MSQPQEVTKGKAALRIIFYIIKEKTSRGIQKQWHDGKVTGATIDMYIKGIFEITGNDDVEGMTCTLLTSEDEFDWSLSTDDNGGFEKGRGRMEEE